MLPGIFGHDRFRYNVESTAKKKASATADALALNVDFGPARTHGHAG